MSLKDIFFVIVLYKTSLEDSKTINSLQSALQENCNLFVFDNSPVRQYEKRSFQFKNFTVLYHHDATNPGLSVAYNSVLGECVKSDKKWLLLLDQDSTFTKGYIDEILSLDFNKFPVSVVAIIPRVISLRDEKIISPVKMFLGGVCRPTDVENGIVNTPIYGINSGTLLDVSYMNSINGFSKNYTLDMLDHWYFRKLFKDGKKICLMGAKIYQDLSVFGNFEENISFERYQQMLNAEAFFIREEGMFSLLVFKFRLILRVLKQYKFKDNAYYKFTLKYILK